MIPSLTLGDFDLTDWSGSNYGVSVIAEGTSKGSPVPITMAVKTWLQDGSVVALQGYDNREVTLRVRLRGPDLVSVADAEAALFAELGKPNTLTWTPGDGISPASVFVVVMSSMDYAPAAEEDIAEGLAFPWRTYNLRLTCEAFVRSVDEVITPALPASGSTTTLVDDGSATTGWTGAVNGTSAAVSVSSGAVKVTTGTAVSEATTASATRTGAITTSATPYLVVDWKPEAASAGLTEPLRAFGDGVELDRISETASPTSGYLRSTFQVAAASVAVLRLDSYSKATSTRNPQVRSLLVDNINRSDVRPSSGTARQVSRSVAVGGSARAQASLTIEHETNALGDVLAYVYPDTIPGYEPALRPRRVAGGAVVTTSATTVSGASDAIAGATSTFEVPVAQIIAGGHLLAARLLIGASPATLTVTWTASTVLGGVVLGQAQTGSTTVTLPAASAYYIVPLARLNLPTVDVDPGSGAVVRITLAGSGGGGINLDEAWLFNTDVGQLVGPVSCGTGTPAAGGPARRLYIDSPTTTTPRPRVMIGHSADRSDTYFPAGALGGWSLPQFAPPRAKVFVVTTNALDAKVSLRYAPRWHTNAAS